MTDQGRVIVPNKRMRAFSSSPRWTSTQSYGPMQPRWDWLERNAYMAFVDLHQHHSALSEVRRAIRGEPER